MSNTSATYWITAFCWISEPVKCLARASNIKKIRKRLLLGDRFNNIQNLTSIQWTIIKTPKKARTTVHIILWYPANFQKVEYKNDILSLQVCGILFIYDSWNSIGVPQLISFPRFVIGWLWLLSYPNKRFICLLYHVDCIVD